MYQLVESNSILTATIVLVGAAVLHASFQLSASVMTLLSGHTLGHKKSHSALLRLCISYLAGNIFSILLLVLAATYIVSSLFFAVTTIWTTLSLLGLATGAGVLAFYYRDRGNRLWLPQGASVYLYERTKRTKRSFEAFSLGVMTGIAEIPFIAAPLLFAGMILRGNPDMSRLGTAVGYALIASLPLLVLFALIGSGKRVSQLERWREKNRKFLQLTSGIGLLALSLYVFTHLASSPYGSSLW